MQDKCSIIFFLNNEADGYVAQLQIPERLLEGKELLKIIDIYGLFRFKILKNRKFSTCFFDQRPDMKIFS
jgi:hypothetical protein